MNDTTEMTGRDVQDMVYRTKDVQNSIDNMKRLLEQVLEQQKEILKEATASAAASSQNALVTFLDDCVRE